MDAATDALNWFEIPASDIERAQKFYETIFDIKMNKLPIEVPEMVTFPQDPAGGKVSGALIKHEWYTPLNNGVLIYLNANPDIQTVLDRIEDAGGRITMARRQISPEVGFMALFIDSEGNRIALHAGN